MIIMIIINIIIVVERLAVGEGFQEMCSRLYDVRGLGAERAARLLARPKRPPRAAASVKRLGDVDRSASDDATWRDAMWRSTIFRARDFYVRTMTSSRKHAM